MKQQAKKTTIMQTRLNKNNKRKNQKTSKIKRAKTPS
jgi:hypothetical protein